MTTPEDKEREFKLRQAELEAKERELRLRELEAEIYQEQKTHEVDIDPPLYELRWCVLFGRGKVSSSRAVFKNLSSCLNKVG